jgi:hypothetical protein
MIAGLKVSGGVQRRLVAARTVVVLVVALALGPDLALVFGAAFFRVRGAGAARSGGGGGGGIPWTHWDFGSSQSSQ